METTAEHLLQTLKRYGPVPAALQEAVAGLFTYRKWQKGDFLLRQGDVARTAIFIDKGFTRNFTLTENGREITTHFAGPGSFALSFHSFKTGLPSYESIVALEHTDVLEISRTQLSHLHNDPAWREIYLGIIEEAYACMEERTFIIQNLSAEEKYTMLIDKGDPDIQKKASLGHIASYLGMTQETLSRVRKKITTTAF